MITEIIGILILVLTMLWANHKDRTLHIEFIKEIRKQKFSKELSVVRYHWVQLGIPMLIVTLYWIGLKFSDSTVISTSFTLPMLLVLGMIAAFDYRTTLIPDRYLVLLLVLVMAYNTTHLSLLSLHESFSGSSFLLDKTVSDFLQYIGMNLLVVAFIFALRFVHPSFFMGLGDIKLLAVMALFYPPNVPLFFSMFILFMALGQIGFKLIAERLRNPKYNSDYIPAGAGFFISFAIIILLEGSSGLDYVVDSAFIFDEIQRRAGL